MSIKFDKVGGFIRVSDGTRYLVLFGPEKYVGISDRVIYLISLISLLYHICDITYVFSHNYARIEIDSFDYLPLEKTFSLHNVIALTKSVSNKNQYHWYYNIF